VVSDIKRSATKVEAEAVDDDDVVSPVEVSKNADSLPQQSIVTSSGLFDDFERSTADLKQPFDSVAPREVSDDEYESLIVFEDVAQQDVEGEEEILGGAALDGGSSDGAASQSSDSEHFDLRTTRALREHYSVTESSDGVSDDEEFPVVSILIESEQHTIGQDGPLETAEQETDLSDAGAFQTFGSDSDIHTASAPKQSDVSERLKTSISDDGRYPVVSVSKDVDEHISEQQIRYETVMQESDASEADTSQTSGTDSDIHTSPASKQSDVSKCLKALSYDKEHTIASVSKDVDQHTDIHDTGLSDADVFDTSDSDVSDMQLPPATIRAPFMSPTGRELTVEKRATIPPEIVLRGLICDAHPEMIHFTLPHSLFSPEDLRKGLQYAYSMLQAATSKLAMLELLEDETAKMHGSDLRRWIALVGDSSPRTRTEALISVVFESLSIGEMKAALEELVQSRLVVEGEVERIQMLLLRKSVVKEQQERSTVIPAKKSTDFDKEGDSSTKKRCVSEEGNETAFDAFLTAIMVVLIGALYLCVREYPMGSAGGWMNMKT
jgi:hypothetical protein